MGGMGGRKKIVFSLHLQGKFLSETNTSVGLAKFGREKKVFKVGSRNIPTNQNSSGLLKKTFKLQIQWQNKD